MQEQVFINCMPEDLPFVREIEERLKLSGFSFYVPPVSINPVIQKEVVEKIKCIAEVHGCMVCILSKNAVSNSLFISNIQLMCESARTGQVLVNYQAESLENDQNIRLFASQAFRVKKSGNPAADISKIIQCIHRVIHPPARNIFQFLSQHISRKVLIHLFSTALVLGVGGSILFNVLKLGSATPVLPTPTPVLMYTPFSGESQDVGLAVDARYVPDYEPDSDPVAEAPFSFRPAVVLEQDDFDDPAFNNIYNAQKWNINNDDFDNISSVAVTQTNGVLQLAVAPVGDRQLNLYLNSKYLFNPEQLTYLGYRFRLEDYQGIKQENVIFYSSFYYQMADGSWVPNINIDGISQKLFGDSLDISLGTRWHTVEMMSQADKHFIDVYLDGTKIRTLLLDDEHLVRWMSYVFAMNVSNTTDWVRLQIDEVVFGSDQPLPQASLSENVPYRFTPDTVDLHEDFETQAYQQYVVEGGEYVTQASGVLVFRVPAENDWQNIRLEIPGKPIDEDNYYAARFRFTSPYDGYWANWAGLYLGLENKSFQHPEEYSLEIGVSRRECVFMGQYGINDIWFLNAYNQNAQPGNWHALEMIIKPPTDGSQAYTAFFWLDGFLFGEGDLQDPASFLDASAPLFAAIRIDNGNYNQDVFSGEIDDLVIGTLSSDKIQE